MTSRRAETRRAYDDRRGSSSERGYTSAWQRAREGFLRAHPLCADHQARGMSVAATVVDHIKAPRLKEATASGDAARIDEARGLFWDRTNWQPLCKACHDSGKQRLEKSGGRPGCDAQGLPLDPAHHWHRAQG